LTLRVVFDTSTLVSAVLRLGSIPHRALAQAFSVGEVCASVSTLSELDEVLRRPKFDRYQSAEVRQAFVDILRLHAALFMVSAVDEENVQPPCRDPKDNKFLALVQASDANVLVSSYMDLLVMNPWKDVPVLTPAQFLR
jgi:putative PIN family toxin of toxin-antitoxin system